jgi:hypothetical protein
MTTQTAKACRGYLGKDLPDLEAKIKKGKVAGDLKSGDRYPANIWLRSSETRPRRSVIYEDYA